MSATSKLDPPAIWKLLPRPQWGATCHSWQMIQDKEDAELPKGERQVYKREFYDKLDFERFLRDRYRVDFVKTVLKLWTLPE